MTTLLVDTSVVIKWFHASGEAELAEARAIRDAHQRGEIEAHVIDLALYELGNVLIGRLGWPASAVADQLDDLLAICGAPLVPIPSWLRDAAALAAAHQLTFHDAAWAASARALGVPLITADTKLIDARLGEPATETVRRLRLR